MQIALFSAALPWLMIAWLTQCMMLCAAAASWQGVAVAVVQCMAAYGDLTLDIPANCCHELQ